MELVGSEGHKSLEEKKSTCVCLRPRTDGGQSGMLVDYVGVFDGVCAEMIYTVIMSRDIV